MGKDSTLFTSIVLEESYSTSNGFLFFVIS